MDKKLKKLKICFLAQYLGEVNRGAETYVLELSKRLSKNYEVDILTGGDSFSLIKILQGKYDFVIPTNGRFQALIVSMGRVFGGYKTIISGQAGIGRDDIWNIAITAPNYYVGITQLEANWSRKWAWATKILTIPNGVDLEKFNPQGKKVEFNLPGKIILSVGALYWYKYHERSIMAAALLDDVSLVIIGSGPLEEKLLKLAEKLLTKNRFKIIRLTYSELPSYYRGADLFVLPSWSRESFGIVYLEAMASGLPVVAPDDLSRKEIVEDAGILVDVSDIDKYAWAIKQALSKKWGDKPRQQAAKFSWDIIARKYEEILV